MAWKQGKKIKVKHSTRDKLTIGHWCYITASKKRKRLSYSASQDGFTHAEASNHIWMHHQYFSERIYHAAKCCVQFIPSFSVSVRSWRRAVSTLWYPKLPFSYHLNECDKHLLQMHTLKGIYRVTWIGSVLKTDAKSCDELTVFHVVMFCIATAPPPTDCQGSSTNYPTREETWKF